MLNCVVSQFTSTPGRCTSLHGSWSDWFCLLIGCSLVGAMATAQEVAQLRQLVEAQSRQIDQLVQQATRPQRGSDEQDQLRSTIDTRVLEKVQSFDGTDAKFTEWRFSFEASCCLLGLENAMMVASSHADEEGIQLVDMSDDVRIRSKALYYLLVSVCKGKAQVLIRGAERHNGLLAWHRMVKSYEPTIGGRFNIMLVGILNPKWRQDDFASSLISWDTVVSEYENQAGKKLEGQVKMAVITQHAPESMRGMVLQASASSGGAYNTFRSTVASYLRAARVFPSDGGAAPMDVSWVSKGKGNGKGKDGNQLGPCNICSKMGHTAKLCWFKGKGKGKDDEKNGKGKGKPFSGECHYCGKSGHRVADCLKKESDNKKKGVGAVDEGDEQDVGAIEIEYFDKRVMAIGLDVAFLSSDVEDQILMAIDSGSEVHTGPMELLWNVPMEPCQTRLRDVQGCSIKVYGQACVEYDVLDIEGLTRKVATTFIVSDTRKFVLSAGELLRNGWKVRLGIKAALYKNNKGIPLERIGNTWYIRCVLVNGPSNGARTVAPLDVETAASYQPPLGETLSAPVGDTEVPAQALERAPERPMLTGSSPAGDMRARLRVLGGAIYGTKEDLFKRVCEYEAIAEKRAREQQWVENRKKQLMEGSRPAEANLPRTPAMPIDPVEIERHEVTHLPSAPWCVACRLSKGNDAVRPSAVKKEASRIQVDYCFMKEDDQPYEELIPENPWCTILCAVDVATQNPLTVGLPGKTAEVEYSVGQLVAFVRRMGQPEVVVRSQNA